jgi:hypothetical protein
MELQVALNSGQATQINAERLVNIYAEQSSGKARVRLTGTPGLTLFSTCGSSPVRGMATMDDVLYVVTSSLYSVDSAGTATEIGAISGTGLVQMASNGTQLVIVADGTIYVYDGTLSTVTDPDAPVAESVDYLDGYHIFSDGSGSFYISSLYDATTFDALDFASAESNPDPIRRVFVDHRELILFGSETTEVWVNTGGVDFPFERQPGAIGEKGIAGANACAKLDNSVVWIDQNGVVRRMASGYAPQRISTHEVERALSESTSLADAEAFAYTQEGHEFFVLTAPGSGTWVFDAATSLWHERQSYGDDRWRARCYAFAYEKHLVGDYTSGNVYELDYSVHDENGDILLSELIFPPIHAEQNRFRMHRLVLDMEHGETEPYGESQVRLDLSDDSQDWTTLGYGSMGETGQRSTRTVWRRLGQHRNAHLRFRISDPVRRTIYAAYAELESDA